jgi:peptide/nickel transport system substrate-binding protein
MKALGQGLSFLFANVTSVEAVDDHTVRFNLDEPYSPFIASLVRLPIVDKQLVMENLGEGDGEMGDWGEAFLSDNGAGTGAYVVVSHNPQEETVMEKNPTISSECPTPRPTRCACATAWKRRPCAR